MTTKRFYIGNDSSGKPIIGMTLEVSTDGERITARVTDRTSASMLILTDVEGQDGKMEEVGM